MQGVPRPVSVRSSNFGPTQHCCIRYRTLQNYYWILEGTWCVDLPLLVPMPCVPMCLAVRNLGYSTVTVRGRIAGPDGCNNAIWNPHTHPRPKATILGSDKGAIHEPSTLLLFLTETVFLLLRSPTSSTAAAMVRQEPM